MNKTIQYYRKDNYGNLHFYIANPETAKAVSVLTRKKTVDANDIAALSFLGFEFKEVIAPR